MTRYPEFLSRSATSSKQQEKTPAGSLHGGFFLPKMSFDNPGLGIPSAGRLCHNRLSSLRATEGSAAISIVSGTSEIASVASLLRNDMLTQSLGRERGAYRGPSIHI